MLLRAGRMRHWQDILRNIRFLAPDIPEIREDIAALHRILEKFEVRAREAQAEISAAYAALHETEEVGDELRRELERRTMKTRESRVQELREALKDARDYIRAGGQRPDMVARLDDTLFEEQGRKL